MKRKVTLNLAWLMTVVLSFMGVGYGQSTLTDGDIAFTRVNGDDPDSFSFVFLTDVQSGTTIYFTTDYYDAGGDYLTQYYFTIRFTATSAISAGEEAHIHADLMQLSFTSGSTLGSIYSMGPVNPFAGNLIHSGGDNILAFQSSNFASKDTTGGFAASGHPGAIPNFDAVYANFIAGISTETGNSGTSGNSWQTNFSVNDCQLPAGKINGQNGWLGMYPFGTSSLNEYDNVRYKETALHTGDKATLLAAIMDKSNWEFHGSTIWPGSSTAFTVTGTATPVSASISSQTNLACNGVSTGSLTATATDGVANYDYVWSNGSSTSNSSSTSNTISGLAAGTYTVTISDDNGSTATASATVTQPTVLSASTGSTMNVTCNGGSNGSASSNATGGLTPYTYSWSNGATTSSVTGISAGTYTVTVTDDNGCTSTASATVTEPTVLAATTAIDNNVSCNGGSDGELTGSGSGGSNPYLYSWSNGGTTASQVSLPAGTYTVTITDNNGCTATSSKTITSPAALDAGEIQ